MKRLAKINAFDDITKEPIYILMNEETFEVELSNGDDPGEATRTIEEAMAAARSWENWETFEWLV